MKGADGMSKGKYRQAELFDSMTNRNGRNGNVDQFPPIGEDPKADANPAIRLFGRRFRDEQTELEYLIEFLLIFVSKKQFGDKVSIGFEDGKESHNWKGLPELNEVENWPDKKPLIYYPKLRLMLKLFAFLGSSGGESRHNSHLEKHTALFSSLQHFVRTEPSVSKRRVLELLEQVLMGFIGVAGARTWCAHSFLPLSAGLIAGETIWEKNKGKTKPDLSWEEVWKEKMFSPSKYNFLARGGEVLYLQLCNLFRKIGSPELSAFEKKLGYGGNANLRDEIENNLKGFFTRAPAPVLDRITRWIEENEGEQSVQIARETQGATCGWCPEESWPEAYLFAVELRNISAALLDPIEKIEMLKFCCVLQVLRSLCAQGGRYWPKNRSLQDENAVQPYAWIITDPNLKDRALKEASRRNLVRIQEMIHGALRTRKPQKLQNQETYKNADQQGPALLLKIGKKIGLIAPYKGPGARFVLPDNLLRYFVLALVPPGKRMRLNTFLKVLYRHYGAAVSGPLLEDAVAWTYPDQRFRPPPEQVQWLEEKLLTTGFLTPLSDAVSLIENPFGEEKKDNSKGACRKT